MQVSLNLFSSLSTSIQLDSACFSFSVWPRVGNLLPLHLRQVRIYPITIFGFYAFPMIPTGHFRFLEGNEQRTTNTILSNWFTQADILHYYSRILNFENILHFCDIVISFAYLIRNCTYIANNLLVLYLITLYLKRSCSTMSSSIFCIPFTPTTAEDFSNILFQKTLVPPL